MGMREKLIDLLVNLTDRLGCQLVGYSLAMKIADRLIANGVTIPVRCRDCKYFGGHGTCYCYAADENGTPIFVREDDFCSYGERKNNG
jgi:hypothetical protein